MLLRTKIKKDELTMAANGRLKIANMFVRTSFPFSLWYPKSRFYTRNEIAERFLEEGYERSLEDARRRADDLTERGFMSLVFSRCTSFDGVEINGYNREDGEKVYRFEAKCMVDM